MARLAQSLPGVQQVNLLPYHKAGGQKFGRLGHTYPLENLEPPSAEKMEQARSLFEERGLLTRIGG